jgi:hypothetical protein
MAPPTTSSRTCSPRVSPTAGDPRIARITHPGQQATPRLLDGRARPGHDRHTPTPGHRHCRRVHRSRRPRPVHPIAAAQSPQSHRNPELGSSRSARLACAHPNPTITGTVSATNIIAFGLAAPPRELSTTSKAMAPRFGWPATRRAANASQRTSERSAVIDHRMAERCSRISAVSTRAEGKQIARLLGLERVGTMTVASFKLGHRAGPPRPAVRRNRCSRHSQCSRYNRRIGGSQRMPNTRCRL